MATTQTQVEAPAVEAPAPVEARAPTITTTRINNATWVEADGVRIGCLEYEGDGICLKAWGDDLHRVVVISHKPFKIEKTRYLDNAKKKVLFRTLTVKGGVK